MTCRSSQARPVPVERVRCWKACILLLTPIARARKERAPSSTLEPKRVAFEDTPQLGSKGRGCLITYNRITPLGSQTVKPAGPNTYTGAPVLHWYKLSLPKWCKSITGDRQYTRTRQTFDKSRLIVHGVKLHNPRGGPINTYGAWAYQCVCV